MKISEQSQLSYIENLMFREELLTMLCRDFTLDTSNPYHHEISSRSSEYFASFEEVYTCYPVHFKPFEIRIASFMLENTENTMKIYSKISFPKNFNWPVIKNAEAQRFKEMECYTGGKFSKWNMALIDKQEEYFFNSVYYLAYDDFYNFHRLTVVQLSDFDLFRTIRYKIYPINLFDSNLSECERTRFEEKSPRHTLKMDYNGNYHVFDVK